MTDSKHTNDNNSLFTRIQVKSPCADERYSAGNSFARLMTRIHADAVNKARPERNYTKAYRIWLAAASLMIVFLTSGWLATALRPAPEMLIRNNAWEKVENLTLADGTQLTLNRGAQLIYPEKFAGRTREIFLSGEAYFDVAHDKKHPFIVRAGDLKIKVLGTKFNIEAYPDSETITTTLLEGSVEVESRLSRECIRMVPSQQLSYDIQSGEMKLSTISDSKEPVRWKDNVWVLHQTPFTQVCHRLEQMFNVKIVIMNDKFIGKKFTGEFRFGDSLESILEVIRITTPFTYEREEDTSSLK